MNSGYVYVLWLREDFNKKESYHIFVFGFGNCNCDLSCSYNNPTIVSALPALLSMAACPLMCTVIGGIMWFLRRSSTSNSHDKQIATNPKEVAPWYDQEMLQHTNSNQNGNLELLGTTELVTGNKNSKNKNIE